VVEVGGGRVVEVEGGKVVDIEGDKVVEVELRRVVYLLVTCSRSLTGITYRYMLLSTIIY
jgi:hypothetical protein